jgi:multidrug resistance efflux pump
MGNAWTWIWAVKKADVTTRASAAESVTAIATEISGRVEA